MPRFRAASISASVMPRACPIEVRSPGNVAELKLALKTDVLEHYESQTGQRTLDHRMVKQKSATVTLTIEEFTKENLALALYGNHVTGSGGTVTGEPVGGATPVVGDRYFLAHPKVSSLVVKDGSTPPVTLVAGRRLHRRPRLRRRAVAAPRRRRRAAGGLRGAVQRQLHATAPSPTSASSPRRCRSGTCAWKGSTPRRATPRCWSSSTGWPSIR